MTKGAKAKAAKRAYRESLLTLSDDELQNMKCEAGRELEAVRSELNGINARIGWIKLEQQRRHVATPAGVHITDHAVVRYLERHMGIDIVAVRGEIGEIAKRARQARRGVRHDAKTGLTIGHCEATGHVTTIYRPRELAAADEWRERIEK